MVYLKKFTLIFYNGSNYDYHFIIKKLAEELEEQFTCLGENNSKFSIPIENEFIRFGKNVEEITKTISYRSQFIDSSRFIDSSSIILLIEFIKTKCKYGHVNKKLRNL